MPGKAVGRAAVDLPWLCPNTDSLIGLAEDPAAVARLFAADPALFTFVVRFASDHAASPPPTDRVFSPLLPETAAAYLAATPAGWVDPLAKVVATIRTVADLAAVFARRLAEHTHRATPEVAETAARLAPLGWYAVAAVDPTEAAACLRDPGFAENPAACQQAWWRLDHDAIARRLAARWRLPRGIAAVVGNLNLPFGAARHVGHDPALFAVVSLAVREAQRRTTDLGLTRTPDRDAMLAHLGLDPGAADTLFAAPVSAPAEPPPASGFDPNPHRVPLVRHLLKMAAEARSRNGASLVVRLEERLDEMHRQLVELGDATGLRLRDAKLAGLAELAAGAGHEINNPLAVISGNAQRLLRNEADAERVETLRSVVRQTQRIAAILRDLMQFTRPAKPEPARFRAGELLTAVQDDLTALAAERGVRLDLANVAADVWLDADSKQLRQVVLAVVRNGVEAAPRDGWVRLTCESVGSTVRFVIEDNGPGLIPAAAEHAFDPFYCGRSAGRGRGLGLSTAWRLARQNGGDVRHEPTPHGPTRFVVTVPLSDEGEWEHRKSA